MDIHPVMTYDKIKTNDVLVRGRVYRVYQRVFYFPKEGEKGSYIHRDELIPKGGDYDDLKKYPPRNEQENDAQTKNGLHGGDDDATGFASEAPADGKLSRGGGGFRSGDARENEQETLFSPSGSALNGADGTIVEQGNHPSELLRSVRTETERRFKDERGGKGKGNDKAKK